MTNSNLLTLLFNIRYQMGYPRFFALAGVVLSRVLLGNSPSPSPKVSWAAAIMLAEEIAEDAITALLCRFGLTTQVPFASVPEPSEIARQARNLSRERGSTNMQRKGCGCCHRRRNTRIHDLTDTSDVVPSSASSDIIEAYRFNHVPQEELQPMPQWAHFVPVYAAELNLVLCLTFFAGGVPCLVGLCDELGYGGVGRGLVWWPFLDAQEPCHGI